MSCVICFQDNAHNVELNCACKVNFCEGCILRWLQENSTCPTCRSLLTITGKAEELTERGMAFFATAQESGFHDKPALKEASNLFLRAIAADRSKPQPLRWHAAIWTKLYASTPQMRTLRSFSEHVPESSPRRRRASAAASRRDADVHFSCCGVRPCPVQRSFSQGGPVYRWLGTKRWRLDLAFARWFAQQALCPAREERAVLVTSTSTVFCH
eukprot:2001234-Rhodomonas_salina.2